MIEILSIDFDRQLCYVMLTLFNDDQLKPMQQVDSFASTALTMSNTTTMMSGSRQVDISKNQVAATIELLERRCDELCKAAMSIRDNWNEIYHRVQESLKTVGLLRQAFKHENLYVYDLLKDEKFEDLFGPYLLGMIDGIKDETILAEKRFKVIHNSPQFTQIQHMTISQEGIIIRGIREPQGPKVYSSKSKGPKKNLLRTRSKEKKPSGNIIGSKSSNVRRHTSPGKPFRKK